MEGGQETPSISRTSVGLRIGFFLAILTLGLGWLAYHDFDVTLIIEQARATHPLMFVLLMSLLPLAGFPIAVFYLFAGAAFPWLQAWLLCLAGLAINMATAYFLTRYLLRTPITRILNSLGYKPPALSPQFKFRMTFLVRTIPGVPFPAQNYLLALADVPFNTYFAVSLGAQGMIAAGMTALGSMLISEEWLKILLALSIIAFLISIKAYQRIARKQSSLKA